jgi:transcriptional regulator with XRE-family HTH domain
MTTIGERIKRARGAAGLSQQALAQRANVSMNGIARLEQDSIKDPHLSQLRKIADALSVSVGELVGEPSPLASAPSASPSPEAAEAGHADEASEEKERRITPVSPSYLEERTRFIKRLKEERKAEIEKVKHREQPPRFAWAMQLEAFDKQLQDEADGILAYAEELDAGGEMAEAEVRLAYAEFSKQLSDFVNLTKEARILEQWAESNIQVDVEHGAAELQRHTHITSPEQRG